MWLSFLTLWQFNCIFNINWSKGHCECTLGCHIDFRERFFFLLPPLPPLSLNLSRRAAVNSPHQQGGQLGGTGSLQQPLELDTRSCLVISFRGREEEPFRTTRSLCFHRNDSRHSVCHTVYLPSQSKGEDSTVINWIVAPAEIGGLIDNHRKGHCSYNSRRKIIILKWIVFSQSLYLEACTVKQNRKQIQFCRRFSWLG